MCVRCSHYAGARCPAPCNRAIRRPPSPGIRQRSGRSCGCPRNHIGCAGRTPLGVLHLLASHPTPPVFDGPEDRNGARNADELRLWREYISAPGPDTTRWLCDDQGRCGGLPADALFVIAGDLNNDPVDGDGRHEAIVQLLEHPRVLRYATPRSDGAGDRRQSRRRRHLRHRGAAAHDTGDFGPKVGNLRLDYVLPSVGLPVVASGVFWPAPDTAEAAIADGSDHHLVWVDIEP